MYRAAVSALFSLVVVLLIMLCEIVCCTCTIVWANKEGRKEGRKEDLWWRRWVLSLEWKVERMIGDESEGGDCDEVIMRRMRWTRRRVNTMTLMEWRRELIPQVRYVMHIWRSDIIMTVLHRFQILMSHAIALWFDRVAPLEDASSRNHGPCVIDRW